MTNTDKPPEIVPPPPRSAVSSMEAAQALRRLAEETLRKEPRDQAPMSAEETKSALHELRVHQIELEMQNDELRRTQVELDRARAEYFNLYDLAPVGYCTISQKGLLLKVNLTAAGLFGVARSALIGMGMSSFIHKEDQNVYFQHYKQLVTTGAAQVFELRLKKSDGAIFWAQLVATAVQDADGLPLCRMVLLDIDQRRRAEEEKEKLEAQLRQAQKMESVGLLAGGVAHDFNNKLAIILGYTEEILGKVAPTETIFADLQEIHQAAEGSAELTRQLLAFARKQTVAPKVLDINDSIEGMLRMLRRLIGEDIDLVWHPATSLWPVKIDPSQIDQILANLCVNARDAIGGIGRLTIETANRNLDAAYCERHIGSTPGEYVLLTVSDNGCGMDQETLDRIFEPFFTTKTFGEGTGLGLATVYGAVKQNNGFIHADSRPGSGTSFSIYLPRHKNMVLPVLQEADLAQADGGLETILLVEDEAAILKITTRMLQRFGYKVLAANSPAEAMSLAKVHAEAIHLLMTDVVMPEMNGRDLAKHLAAFMPQMKVLLMSGYTADIIAQQGKLDAALHFIEKPFSKNELADKVREVLAGEEGQES